MDEYPDDPLTDEEGRTLSWWGVCLTCGEEPHNHDHDSPRFGLHREGCPAQASPPRYVRS